MYLKNKTTGIVWHITDETHQKRLQADSNYLEVTNSKGKEDNETGRHEQLNDPINKKTEKVGYSMMDWHELRQLASAKGINTKGMKRKELEKELVNLGDEDVTG